MATKCNKKQQIFHNNDNKKMKICPYKHENILLVLLNMERNVKNMVINWKQIVCLILKMWDRNQNDIADCLMVNRSTITRLKQGKILHFNIATDEIYNKIFNPENPQSFAYKENPKELLERLKVAIQENDLSEVTKDLQSSDYKTYVMEMLRLARKNEHDVSGKGTYSCESSETEQNGQENTNNYSQITTPSECKKCCCCKSWEGKIQDVLKCSRSIERRCVIYDKRTMSDDGTDCEKFDADYRKMGSFLFKQKYKNIFS